MVIKFYNSKSLISATDGNGFRWGIGTFVLETTAPPNKKPVIDKIDDLIFSSTKRYIEMKDLIKLQIKTEIL